MTRVLFSTIYILHEFFEGPSYCTQWRVRSYHLSRLPSHSFFGTSTSLWLPFKTQITVVKALLKHFSTNFKVQLVAETVVLRILMERTHFSSCCYLPFKCPLSLCRGPVGNIAPAGRKAYLFTVTSFFDLQNEPCGFISLNQAKLLFYRLVKYQLFHLLQTDSRITILLRGKGSQANWTWSKANQQGRLGIWSSI